MDVAIPASLLDINKINHPTSSLANLGSTRSFGRKASRMGHHLQNLDDKAHESSREEAQVRREEKKKKSKKARLNAHKENNNSTEDAGEEEEDMDTSLGSTEDGFGNPVLPEVSDVRAKMLMVIAAMEKSLASVRGGEATPELFDAVRVSAYGEIVPLSSVGQVVIEDPQRATISCYDPSVANDVRDAVRDMPGMNLNPYLEEGGSGVVIVPIPRVSAETRKEIVKELSRKAENEKQHIRRIRRDAMDVVKKGQSGKLEGVSKDDAFRVGKEIEAVTEEVLAALSVIVEKKQKSVMDD
jgi:ribosome recycling factor